MKKKLPKLSFNYIAAAFLFLFFSFFSRPCKAAWLRNQFEGVRPLGMGNAFLAIADDKNALWYNPAGLAFIKDSRLDFNDFILGGDSIDTVERIQRAALRGEVNSLWRKDTQMGRVGFFPAYYGPHFGVSAYYSAFGFSEVDNFDGEEVDIYAVSDLGVLASAGMPFHKNFSGGISLRGMARKGIDKTQNGLALARALGITQAQLANSLYSNLWPSAKLGYGFGVNAGLLWRLPRPRLSFAATAEDIGHTNFKGIDGGTPPPPIRGTYHFGMAMTFPLKRGNSLQVALDFHHLLERVIFVKQTHLGVEWTSGMFSLRAGLNQGYLTTGFSFNTDFVRVAFSTHATELGNSLWERSHRWYQAQLVFGAPLSKVKPTGRAQSFKGIRER